MDPTVVAIAVAALGVGLGIGAVLGSRRSLPATPPVTASTAGSGRPGLGPDARIVSQLAGVAVLHLDDERIVDEVDPADPL